VEAFSRTSPEPDGLHHGVEVGIYQLVCPGAMLGHLPGKVVAMRCYG